LISLSKSEIIKGVLEADRVILSRAITFVESVKHEHRALMTEVLERLMTENKKSLRLGITGVPGVGKSTFIETFGLFLIEKGYKVAVLTIDPSSKQSGGSILGDKTRMDVLSKNENAFIRPSPAGSSLGGVARKTREAMLLCEAAGYDIIIIETVGVGQSETAVSEMVDLFLLLMLSGAGDELQGIKKGIMESADIIAINKADGDNILKSREAQSEYRRAIQMFPSKISSWQTEVLTVSALFNQGISELWESMEKFQNISLESNYFNENRKDQLVKWFEGEIEHLLQEEFIATSNIKKELPLIKDKIKNGEMFPYKGASYLIKKFLDNI
jgi:LAO/AO transport system kinase